jgi:hypothetical protein
MKQDPVIDAFRELPLIIRMLQQLCLLRIGQETAFYDDNRRRRIFQHPCVSFPEGGPVGAVRKSGNQLCLNRFRQLFAFVKIACSPGPAG